MTFDLKKAMENGGRCQTRDGHPVRIICADRSSCRYPVVVLIDELTIETYTANGRFREETPSDLDLVNISTKREGWANLYPDGTGYVAATRELADKNAASHRVACVRIEWEEPT